MVYFEKMNSKSWIVDFFSRFTRGKIPQNNLSRQNFSIENNYSVCSMLWPLDSSTKHFFSSALWSYRNRHAYENYFLHCNFHERNIFTRTSLFKNKVVYPWWNDSSEMLQNLPYFWNTKTYVILKNFPGSFHQA